MGIDSSGSDSPTVTSSRCRMFFEVIFPSQSVMFSQPLPQGVEHGAAAAQLTAQHAAPVEVAMNRIGDVDANAAVHVLGAMADAMPRLAGEPGYACRLGLAGEPGIQAVAKLPERRAQRLQVDLRISHAHLDRLEAVDALIELAPLG